MTVEEHIEYVSSFYPNWDRERERRLLDERDREARRPRAEADGERDLAGVEPHVVRRDRRRHRQAARAHAEALARARALQVVRGTVDGGERYGHRKYEAG